MGSQPSSGAALPASRSLDAARDLTDYRALALGWVAVASVARFLCVAALPLGNGEAYYASWARFPAWSYYDHPPLVAWMVWLTTSLGSSALAVRMGPILCAAAFGLLFHRLAERFVTPRAALLALVIVSALPVFLASSFILNPEAPMAPLWVATLLALDDLRTHDEPWRPLIAGGLLGLTFLAKYTALLLVPATFLYLALSPGSRRWLSRPTLYLAGLVALTIALPVVLWNQAHGWPSLQLHFGERNHAALPVPGENPFNTLVGDAAEAGRGPGVVGSALRMLVGQAMSYSPLLSPLLAVGLLQLLWGARRDEGDRFLAVFGIATLLPLMVALVKIKDSEQHWTMMAMVPAVIGAARFADARWDTSRALRTFVSAGLSVSALVFILANIHAHSTGILRLIPADKYDPHADIVNELVGWEDVRASIERNVQRLPGPVVLASTHYSLCGRLMFETDDKTPVYCPTVRRTEFDFLGRRHPPAGATVLALTSGVHEQLPAELLNRKCSPLDTVEIVRAGRHVAQYYLHACAPLDPGAAAPSDAD
jgi:hypothetical protein